MAGLAAQGLTNEEIAERLFISVQGVKNHLHHSYEVMGYPTVRGVQRVRLALDYWRSYGS